MDGFRGNSHPVGERAAAAEHDVAGRQLELPHCPRIQREQPSESPLTDAEALQRGGVDRAAGEASADAGLVVEQREDRRVGIQVGDRSERPLGATHHEQVVVRQGHTSVRHEGCRQSGQGDLAYRQLTAH